MRQKFRNTFYIHPKLFNIVYMYVLVLQVVDCIAKNIKLNFKSNHRYASRNLDPSNYYFIFIIEKMTRLCVYISTLHIFSLWICTHLIYTIGCKKIKKCICNQWQFCIYKDEIKYVLFKCRGHFLILISYQYTVRGSICVQSSL